MGIISRGKIYMEYIYIRICLEKANIKKNNKKKKTKTKIKKNGNYLSRKNIYGIYIY